MELSNLTPAEATRATASSKVLSDIDAGIRSRAKGGSMHFDYKLDYDICEYEVNYITKLIKKAGYHVCYYEGRNSDTENVQPFLRIFWNG